MYKFYSFYLNLFFVMLIGILSLSCQKDEVVSNDKIIKLRVFDSNNIEINQAIIGNGETLITLEVTIPRNASASYSTVTFRKSAGQFIGGTEDKIIKPIDNDGKARVNLKVPLSGETLLLSAEIGNGSNLFIDEETISLTTVEDVINLEILNINEQQLTTPVKADGTTQLYLKATVLANTSILNQITFNISNGVFLTNNLLQIGKSTNQMHQAMVSLRVPKNVGPLYFSSGVGTNPQYLDELNLILERAFPDIIIIEPTMITMNTTVANLIKVTLLRNQGFVSTGTIATFEAFQVIGGNEINVGRFTGLANATTNGDGQINVNFYADTNNFVPNVPVKIRVKSFNDSNVPIESLITLSIN